MDEEESTMDQERNQRHVGLLDALNVRFSMNDREVADLLMTKKGIVCDVRGGRRDLTFQQELRAYSHLGYAWARAAMLKLLPDEVQENLLELDNARTKAGVEELKDAGQDKTSGSQKYKSGPAM
ncbi:MAG: hypothetical protein K8H75_11650 [Sulfuricella sp.]|nr:hypothetical protein [Sulfuricella sp.]